MHADSQLLWQNNIKIVNSLKVTLCQFFVPYYKYTELDM